jgi:hypothetical protein
VSDITFALVGLYLCVEKHLSGKEVQQAHMQLAKKRKAWPRFSPPDHEGDITVAAVLDASPGKARDEMIRVWCVSVWEACGESRQQVRDLKAELGIV